MEDTCWLTMRDQTPIFIKIWKPEMEPKAIIQLSHGMAEHIGRYEEFGKIFAQKGYLVFGNDHRGHGQTGLKQGLLGYFANENGFSKTVDDLKNVAEHVKAKYPTLPFYLFGHSMGSFIARNYIQTYSNRIDGLILSGTGYYPPAVIKSAKQMAKQIPAKEPSDLMNKLVFGKNNKRISPNHTPFDWLSRDKDEVSKYIADPLSGFVPTGQFFIDLFKGIEIMQSANRNALIRKDLPILFISGDHDPIGNYSRGVWKAANLYNKLRLTNISVLLFEGARHELLHEINKSEVFTIIDKWLNESTN